MRSSLTLRGAIRETRRILIGRGFREIRTRYQADEDLLAILYKGCGTTTFGLAIPGIVLVSIGDRRKFKKMIRRKLASVILGQEDKVFGNA